MHIKNALKTLANRLTKNYTSPSPTASQGTSAPPGATVKPPVIITTRFSHWDPKAKNSWRIGRVDDEEQYKKALFDEKRLAAKFSIFEQVTLPSIAGQSDLENVYLTLVTSEDLPEPFKKGFVKLSQATVGFQWTSSHRMAAYATPKSLLISVKKLAPKSTRTAAWTMMTQFQKITRHASGAT